MSYEKPRGGYEHPALYEGYLGMPALTPEEKKHIKEVLSSIAGKLLDLKEGEYLPTGK